MSTPGAVLVQNVIDAADQLARWSPEDLTDAFCTLRELPDMLGSIAEALSVTAAAAEDARAVRSEVISAAEVAAGWTASAAAGMGEEFSRWTMLRTNATRWLPRSGAA